MNYGLMIKNARKKLGLIQADLSSDNLSRANVSDIEKGKANLVASKGLLIYEVLVTHSFEKDVEIELNFDELLSENIKYTQLKQAREIVQKLKRAKEEDKAVQHYELENHRLFAIRNDIGMLKYFILRRIADLSNDNKEFKVKVLFNALDYLKWLKFAEIYEKYDKTLRVVTGVANVLKMFKELLTYYSFYENNAIDNDIKIDALIYFNLGVLHKKSENYRQSYKYTERYLDFSKDTTLIDRADAITVLGNLSIKMNDIDRGIEHYEEVIDMLGLDGDVKTKSFALSNLVFNISIFNAGKKEEVSKWLEELESSIEYLKEVLSNFSILCLYMSVAYEYIGEGKKSLNYMSLALESSESSSQSVFTLSILKKHTSLLNDTDSLCKMLENIDYLSLDCESKLKYNNLLLNAILLNKSVHSMLDKQLGGLIEEIGGYYE